MEIILKYFPDLTDSQKKQFAALYDLYLDWNAKINVISRKDIVNLYERHVLHSLSIAELIRFKPGTKVLDVGTGGGFPGIPLAILFPDTAFTLIDATGKKIKVGLEVASAIGLNNTTLKHLRMQDETAKFDFVVSRAVMPLDELLKLTRKNISTKHRNVLPNGLICLKGGELQHEIRPYKHTAEVCEISDFFREEYFKTKKIVYLPM
ncbi:MAG: 16S rRNA (guanine(527)-N(7))-methyltransferase RsmG [Prevotellaceae bacterium]|jgi:16S rRNA (guanine527-N7)-methyltransferase|nr:16S rRNA (guanine(527)-N(7))-methyltransferase RsmG [Prevotellaceae bacterium]